MKYSVNNYVDAFSRVSKTATHDTIEGFIKLLKKTGDIRHTDKIIEAIHRKTLKEKGGKWVTVEVARESALKKGVLKNKYSEKDHVDFKINQELIAGVRITVDGEEEMDNSLNNKLKKLFK